MTASIRAEVAKYDDVIREGNAAGKSVREIAAELDIPKGRVYRRAKELKLVERYGLAPLRFRRLPTINRIPEGNNGPH